jgi:pentose-5-phosphate-3-epimerase
VDGGIDAETAPRAVSAGANVLVSGTQFLANQMVSRPH